MNRFSYFIVVCMVLSGLLISGCRKDAWDDTDKISTTNLPFDGYHPKFDTIPHHATGFSGGAGATVIAPTTLQLAEMKTAFDWIPYGSPLSLKIGALYDLGYRIDINYSILFLSDNPDKYMIAVPYMYNNEVASIIYYYHDATSQGRFLIVEKEEVINQIQQNGSSISGLMPVFGLIAGAFNTIQISKDSTYNATINTWLNNYIDNKRESTHIEPRDILTICATYYSFNLVGSTEYIKVWEECYSTSTGGTPNGFFGLTNFGTGGDSGQGGSGGEGGSGDQDSDGPVLAGECWQNISELAQEAIVEVMESYYSPCPEEQEAINEAIQSVIDDICAEIEEKGKVLGTGYETLNLNKSTVTHRVMNKLGEKIDGALNGQDYINLNEIPINKSDCSKSDAQNIADFTNYMQLNGGCSGEGFQNALNSYLGLTGVVDQNNPILSANTKKMCAGFFDVRPSSNPNESHLKVAGISGLQLLFNTPNGGTPLAISFNYLFIKLTPNGCSLSTSDYNEILAIAMNNAVAIAQERISNRQPIRDNTSNSNGMQFVSLYKEQIERVAGNYGCSQLHADPRLSNVTRDVHSSGWDSHCGANFVEFNNSNFNTSCP